MTTEFIHYAVHNGVRRLRELFGVRSQQCDRCERERSRITASESALREHINEIYESNFQSQDRVRRALVDAKDAVNQASVFEQMARRQSLPSTRVGTNRAFFTYSTMGKLDNFPLAEGTSIVDLNKYAIESKLEDMKQLAKAANEVVRAALEASDGTVRQ